MRTIEEIKKDIGLVVEEIKKLRQSEDYKKGSYKKLVAELSFKRSCLSYLSIANRSNSYLANERVRLQKKIAFMDKMYESPDPEKYRKAAITKYRKQYESINDYETIRRHLKTIDYLLNQNV